MQKGIGNALTVVERLLQSHFHALFLPLSISLRLFLPSPLPFLSAMYGSVVICLCLRPHPLRPHYFLLLINRWKTICHSWSLWEQYAQLGDPCIHSIRRTMVDPYLSMFSRGAQHRHIYILEEMNNSPTC